MKQVKQVKDLFPLYTPYFPLFVTPTMKELQKKQKFIPNIRKWLGVQKLKFISWCGFKLTPDERSEICYWLTRKVTKSNAETLAELNGEYYGDELIQ